MPKLLIPIDNFLDQKYTVETKKIFDSLPYEPIWQSISWSKMLLETGYAQACFLVGISENETLKAFAIAEKRSI